MGKVVGRGTCYCGWTGPWSEEDEVVNKDIFDHWELTQHPHEWIFAKMVLVKDTVSSNASE